MEKWSGFGEEGLTMAGRTRALMEEYCMQIIRKKEVKVTITRDPIELKPNFNWSLNILAFTWHI